MSIVILCGLVITLATCIPVFMQMRNHPKGLHILFFAEMWERFSYYGMRGLLIFYLTQHFLFSDTEAQSQYGSYTALVYLLPLLGGFLADKYLGNRKAIAFGALLLVAGHLTMGLEGEPAKSYLNYTDRSGVSTSYELEVEGRTNSRQVFLQVGDQRCAFVPRTPVEGCSSRIDENGSLVFTGLNENAPLPQVIEDVDQYLSEPQRNPLYLNIFYLALALIVVGVGYLKANISSIVGQLYEDKDPRRDGGFTLYYYGINLGSFWAAILCGYLGETVGWWAGFGLAGLGMLLGWLVFVRRRLLFFTAGEPQLPDHVGAPPNPEKLSKPVFGALNFEHVTYLIGIFAVLVVWFVVQAQEQVLQTIMAVGAFLFVAYLGYFMVKKCSMRESMELTLAFILIVMSVVFWTLFEQAGSSLNQFAERSTQLPSGSVGPLDMTVTASQVQSFNAGFILILAPVFAALWAFLDRMKYNPNTPLKFGLALVQVGLGFWVLVWGVAYADDSYRVPLVFLALCYLLHTTGELCLSPVGLSMITKLSPAAIVSFMMAGWFFAGATANFVAGQIAKLTASDTVAGQVLNPKAALETYSNVFWDIGLWAVVIGVILGASSFYLKRLGHGKA